MTQTSLRAYLLLFGTALFAFEAYGSPTVVAISGGIGPLSNHGRYYVNLEKLQKNFKKWKIFNLVADGPGSKQPNSLESDYQGTVSFDQQGLPILAHLEPKANYTGPATQQAIAKTVKDQSGLLKPDEPILIYITDHGGTGSGPENREAELWGEKLPVPDLRTMIKPLAGKHPVVLLNDQCYGGGMLEAAWENGTLLPGICGFASASASQVALHGGGIMENIDKVCNAKPAGAPCTFSEVYRHIKISENWHHDSTPISTSDLFLQKIADKNPTLLHEFSKAEYCVSCNSKSLFTGFSKIDEIANASLATLLQGRVVQLEKDLKSDCKQLKLQGLLKNACDEKITEAFVLEVKKRKQEEEAKYARIEASLHQGSTQNLKERFNDWFAHEQPKLNDSYIEIKQKIDALMKQMTAGDKSVEAQLRLLQKEFKSIKMNYDLRLRVIKGDVKADPNGILKNRFLSFNPSKSSSKDSSETILHKYKMDSEALMAQRKRLQPLIKFHNDLMTTTTLTALTRSHDTAALTQYLDLLTCENQVICPR